MLATLLGLSPSRRRIPPPDALMAAATRIRDLLGRPREKRLDVARVLYMANLLHVARHGGPLFDDAIQATTYGPIVPRMLDEMGRHSRRGPDAYHPASLSRTQIDLIEEVCAYYRDATSAALVATVHAEGGAWARRYTMGFPTDRGPRITEQDLRDEAAARLSAPATEETDD